MATRNSYDYPTSTELVDENRNVTVPWAQWIQRTQSIVRTLNTSGPTSQRPVDNLWIGQQYWDTTLGSMVWLQSYAGGVATWVAAGGGGGGAAWGSITGTLSAQTDLQSALNAKASNTALLLVNAKTLYTKGATWDAGSAALVAPASDISMRCPVAGTITNATVLTQGGPGSCVIDIWKAPYASYPPTVANSITSATPPTVTAGIKAQNTTLTGWATAVSAGDILLFHLVSTSTFTNIHIELEITP